MLQEPGTSQYDLKFEFLGFPVRVAWGFWLVAAILGWHWSDDLNAISVPLGMDSPGAAILLAIWIAAIFLSILVHELGHTLAMRYYGVGSRIVLYHFGGLAVPDGFGSWNAARQRQVGPKEQIIISAAGPAFQLLLALVVWLIGLSLGIRMEVTQWANWLLGASWGVQEFPGSAVVYASFDAILFPSTVWAILNLAPILPLDGGQILRSGLMLSRVQRPMHAAHLVSIGVAALIGLYFLNRGEMFGIMFLLFAVSNWQAMQYGSGIY